MKSILPTIVFLVIIFSGSFIHAQNDVALDTAFGLGTFNNSINVVKRQPDGKILVGGNFTYYKKIA